MVCPASPTSPPDKLDGPCAGGGLPASVALLTRVPPLGTGGMSGMIGTAPGMFGTGSGGRDPVFGPNGSD
jgi:hypothetical protein